MSAVGGTRVVVGASADTGDVTSVTAASTAVVVTPTTGAVTVDTSTLDVIATAHPPIAAVPLNSQKITGLANGTAATDAAAFGQIPTALPPNGAAGGDLSGTYPNPVVAKSSAFPFAVTNSMTVGGTITLNGTILSTGSAGGLAVQSGKAIQLQGSGKLVFGTATSGSQTATAVSVTTTTPSSGTAFTPNANLDTAVMIPITAGAVNASVTITYGPTTGAENTIVSSGNLLALQDSLYSIPRVPNGWKVVVTVTGSGASIGATTIQTC